jgi:hypothetical protein
MVDDGHPMGDGHLGGRCVYKCNSVESLPAMNTIYQSLPERSAKLGRVEDIDKYEELQKRADDLDKHLTAVEMLSRSVPACACACAVDDGGQPLI